MNVSNQTTSNGTSSSTFNITSFEIAPPSLIISLKIVTAWIIITNGLVLLCLVFNRRALKNFVNLQVLSMSVTDVLLGISFIPIIQSFQDVRSFGSYWSCFSVICAYTIAQHATICHALAICVYRLIKIKGLTVSSETNQREIVKKLIIQVTVPWTECILFIVSVFMIYGKHDKQIRFCSLNELFEDRYMDFMIVCLFNTVIPHVTMDVIYVYILLFLRKRWGRISALRVGDIMVVMGTSSTSADDTAETRLSGGNQTGPKQEAGQPNGRSLLPSTESGRKTTKTSHGKSTVRIQQRQLELSKAKIREERKVNITIGLFLLVLNVFMTPVSLIVIVELFASSPLSRQVKFSMVIFPLINSVINPIIYMLRIKPLRQVIGNAWRKLAERFC